MVVWLVPCPWGRVLRIGSFHSYLVVLECGYYEFIICQRHKLWSYKITFSEITPANRNRLGRNSTEDVGSRGTLSCKALAPSAKPAQNGDGKKRMLRIFCHRNNASFHSFPGGRLPWNSECGLRWRSVASSLNSGWRWGSGNEECSDAGTSDVLASAASTLLQCFSSPYFLAVFSHWVNWVWTNLANSPKPTPHPEGLEGNSDSKSTIHHLVQSLKRGRQSWTSRGINSPRWQLLPRSTNNCSWARGCHVRLAG